LAFFKKREPKTTPSSFATRAREHCNCVAWLHGESSDKELYIIEIITINLVIECYPLVYSFMNAKPTPIFEEMKIKLPEDRNF